MKAVSPALREARGTSVTISSASLRWTMRSNSVSAAAAASGVELGDYFPGEAFLEVEGVDGAGSEGLGQLGDLVVWEVCYGVQVVGDQVVVEAHDLEVGVLRGFGDADVVVQALAHALDAVGADEDGDQAGIAGASGRPWTGAPRPRRRLNFWSVPPNSTSASTHCRVVGLEERVEEFGDGDGAVGLETVGEVLTGEESGRR